MRWVDLVAKIVTVRYVGVLCDKTAGCITCFFQFGRMMEKLPIGILLSVISNDHIFKELENMAYCQRGRKITVIQPKVQQLSTKVVHALIHSLTNLWKKLWCMIVCMPLAYLFDMRTENGIMLTLVNIPRPVINSLCRRRSIRFIYQCFTFHS